MLGIHLTTIVGREHFYQEVCPFTRRSVPKGEAAFQPGEATLRPKLTDLLELTEEEFRENFGKSPVKRQLDGIDAECSGGLRWSLANLRDNKSSNSTAQSYVPGE